ncbi:MULTISPECIES: hypothetical protein [Actinosynnema]|uniref:hypothetical protein n=1 Tax=Actinosynnema TaxID=40566 RepID=UPI0020A2A766|nr:hypothetical protein [Actinosynnema pretiosum]MCP2097317.1 hypothetical protein [Actinosynnema pretiosum]
MTRPPTGLARPAGTVFALDEHDAPDTTSAERGLLVWLCASARMAVHNHALDVGQERSTRAHLWWFSVLLAHGRLFTPTRGESDDLEYGEPGTCYATAHSNTCGTGLLYVEGFADPGSPAWLATEHAWCARPGGRQALDPTWTPPGSAYLGIAFTRGWRQDAYAEMGHPVPLLSADHAVGRRLLERGVPEHAVEPDVGRALPESLRTVLTQVGARPR